MTTEEFDFDDDRKPRYPDAPGFMRSSQTSREAADDIAMNAASLRYKVYKFIYDSPHGATCDEAEVALDMKHQTASARITELRLAGKVTAEGTRLTRSGRKADVLHATKPEENS